jgi:hypothetical protein
MNPQRIITALAATLVLASTTAWLLAQERPAPAPLTDQQLQRIRPINPHVSGDGPAEFFRVKMQ